MASIAVIVVGDYSNRLAAVHSDNGAVFYSYLYEHSTEFAQDPFAAPGIHWLWGSICFWGPVLAHKYLDIDSRIPDVAFLFLQIFLLGFSVFILTRKIAQSLTAAFASMGAAIILQPWVWNLAAYPMWIDLPLYTTLAVALSVCAAAALLSGRNSLAWLLLFLIALIHPIIAIDLLVMLSAWLWLNRRQLERPAPPKFIVSLLVLLPLFAPFLIRLGFSEPVLTAKEHWESVAKHMHSVPWGNSSLFKDLASKAASFFLLMACFWKQILALPLTQRRFLLAAALGTLALGTVQLVGIELKMADVALTMGLRTVSILVLLLWPFLFAFVFSGRVLVTFEAFFTFLLAIACWYRIEGGIPAYNLILLAAFLNGPFRGDVRRRLIYCLVLSLVPLLVLLAGHPRWIFWHAMGEVSVQYYVEAIVGSAILADFLTVRVLAKPIMTLAAAGLVLFALIQARAAGMQTHDPFLTSLREAELWAREHTAPGTIFLANVVGWRTLSQRPAAMLNPDMTEEIYTPFRSIRDRNDYLFALYGLSGRWRAMGISGINTASMQGYMRLKASDFARIGHDFHARYLVRGQSEPALDFPIVFQNSGYRIYRLPM